MSPSTSQTWVSAAHAVRKIHFGNTRIDGSHGAVDAWGLALTKLTLTNRDARWDIRGIGRFRNRHWCVNREDASELTEASLVRRASFYLIPIVASPVGYRKDKGSTDWSAHTRDLTYLQLAR